MSRGRAHRPTGHVPARDRAPRPGQTAPGGQAPALKGSAAARIGAYRPRKATQAAWDTVRPDVVSAALAAVVGLGLTGQAADRVVRSLAHLALWWTVVVGRQLDVEAMLAPDAIEEYAETLPGTSPAAHRTRQTVRSELRRTAWALSVPGSRPPATYGAADRLRPHTTAERGGHYRAARELPEPWRTWAVLLLDLSYGAGLSSGESETLTGDQVTAMSDGCVLRLPARASRGRTRPARVVHVVGPAGRRIAQTAADTGPGVLLAPQIATRGQKVEKIALRLRQRPRTVPFAAARAADRWAVDLLDRLPLRAVADMAGWGPTCSTPSQLSQHTTPIGPLDRLALLRRHARDDAKAAARAAKDAA